jgi:hypothetical protein
LCRNCGGQNFLVEREGKSGKNSWPRIYSDRYRQILVARAMKQSCLYEEKSRDTFSLVPHARMENKNARPKPCLSLVLVFSVPLCLCGESP